MVLAQLWVPTSMIISKEKVLKEGVAYKFRCAPVDPADVFRGRYIVLRFDAQRAEIADTSGLSKSYDYKQVFVSLKTDSAGFALVDKVTQMPPAAGDYVAAKGRAQLYQTPPQWFINYPFDQYYMEESKAPVAEGIYWDNIRIDSSDITYALVKILDGDAVIEDVIVNDRPISELAEEEIKRRKDVQTE